MSAPFTTIPPLSFHNGRVHLHAGDSRSVLKTLPDASIDSVATDPPYALVSIVKRFGKAGSAPAKAEHGGGAYARASAGFMGQEWDTGETAFAVEFWAEVLRVLKPGGHVAAFGGTRTYHRLAVAIEDAGFEIRDQLGWLYGCLDTETMAVSAERGPVSYTELKPGDLVLVYDVAAGIYSHQPVQEVVEYDYDDIAFRLVGSHGEQVVSRNHRCIIERGGSEVFQRAETLERETHLPFLEDLSALQCAIHDAYERASSQNKSLLSDMQEYDDRPITKESHDTFFGSKGPDDRLHGVQKGVLEAERLDQADGSTDVLTPVQWSDARPRVGDARAQGGDSHHSGRKSSASCRVTRSAQSSMEWRSDISAIARETHGCRLRPLSAGISADGAQGRLHHGASVSCGANNQSPADANGSRASYQPPVAGQSARKPDAVSYECRAQGIRGWSGHQSDLVRVMPFHHVGKVWCLRVPTGAFVAVRGGIAFPTGNSGFPKSHNVSKGIDKAAGAEREVVGVAGRSGAARSCMTGDFAGGDYMETSPATDEARQWSGWGTALKPAWESIVLARKPLVGTVAENVLTHGTGAINIDGCRVSSKPRSTHARGNVKGIGGEITAVGLKSGYESIPPQSRFPANILHDGSAEVAGAFCLYADDALRFFYSAKADSDDRLGSKHPTVKPVDLMRWLVRLITPPGGVVLDPFAGTGTSGHAALIEGMSAILIEREPAYQADIARRMDLVFSGQDERARKLAKADPHESMPLFGGVA